MTHVMTKRAAINYERMASGMKTDYDYSIETDVNKEAIALQRLQDAFDNYRPEDDMDLAGKIVEAAVEAYLRDAYVRSSTGKIVDGLTMGVHEDILRVVQSDGEIEPSMIGWINSHWQEVGIRRELLAVYGDVDGRAVLLMSPEQAGFASRVTEEANAVCGVYAARYDAQNQDGANRGNTRGLLQGLL